MAFTGHSGWQAPQAIQVSLIFRAMAANLLNGCLQIAIFYPSPASDVKMTDELRNWCRW
jgi:hypothetical protein